MWKATATSENEAEILLYDRIAAINDDDFGMTNAKGIIKQIKALGKIENITLRINSIGGDVFEAQTMYNYLRTHPANITVRVDGIAASAASVVAMAGNKVIMPSNALMMIHNPASIAYGEAEDMRDSADILDKIRDSMVEIYASKTGLTREKLISMMDEETWFSAKEAKELKFCDEVEEAAEITAMAVNGGVVFGNKFGFSLADMDLRAEIPENADTNNAENFISGFGFVRENGAVGAGIPENTAKNSLSSPEKTTIKEEKSEMEIKSAADLVNAYPDFVEQIRAAANTEGYERGVKEERERLKMLDSLNAQGSEAIIAKAKYEEPKDARDIAIEILQAARSQAQLNAMYQDAGAVNSALPPKKDMTQEQAERDAAISAVASELNRMRGYK